MKVKKNYKDLYKSRDTRRTEWNPAKEPPILGAKLLGWEKVTITALLLLVACTITLH